MTMWMSGLAGIDCDAIAKRGCIRQADVADLVRRHEDGGALSVPEAEQLLRLNSTCRVQDAMWPARFVEVLADHIVHQTKPEGYVTTEKADWLIARIVRGGRIATLAEFELLLGVLEASRWSPERLAISALGAVRDAVLFGAGPLRAGIAEPSPRVTAGDAAVLARILIAFGAKARLAPTRGITEILLAIDRATAGADNAAEWTDIYVAAVGLALMAASHHAVPEPARVFEATGGDRPMSPDRVLSLCHLQTAEERAIERLERQRLAIITGEEPSFADAEWLSARLGDAGRRATPNEASTFHHLVNAEARLAPDLADLIVRLGRAA